ncbi:MAG TPA: cyclic nucleotide-binding domain-containing protein [Labilithrix sp.]|jgi:CRP-like cAMP-binding protein
MPERIAALLRKVEFLADVDDATLLEVARRARRSTYASGDRIVCELDAGADLFVVASGVAEISVEPRAGERQVLGTLKEGGAFGEMSSLTGELRSATVTAKGEVECLVLADADFDRLRERRPEIAIALVRTLGERLAKVEGSIDALLEPAARASAAGEAAANAGHAHVKHQRGSLARAWRELVVSRKRDLAFLTLTSFVLTLVVVRAVVRASFELDFAPRDVLRGAYMTGFALVVASACAALLTFRPGLRRLVAVAYGVGVALILNELGVTLAFDIFYKDIHTPDPNVAFDIERLYSRAEPLRAIAIGLVVLVQAAYLRRFWRRAWFIGKTRLRKLLAR